MRAFSYHIPTQIEFGNGAIARLPEFVKALGGSRVLVVGDPGVQRAGLIDRVQAILTGASIFNAVFADVESDPATRSVDEGTVHGKANGCDLVVLSLIHI